MGEKVPAVMNEAQGVYVLTAIGHDILGNFWET